MARCNAVNPTSEKPKFGKGSAQCELKRRGPGKPEINFHSRHNMAYRAGYSLMASMLKPFSYLYEIKR